MRIGAPLACLFFYRAMIGGATFASCAMPGQTPFGLVPNAPQLRRPRGASIKHGAVARARTLLAEVRRLPQYGGCGNAALPIAVVRRAALTLAQWPPLLPPAPERLTVAISNADAAAASEQTSQSGSAARHDRVLSAAARQKKRVEIAPFG